MADRIVRYYHFKAPENGDVARVAPSNKISVVQLVIFGLLFLLARYTLLLDIGRSLIFAGALLLLCAE